MLRTTTLAALVAVLLVASAASSSAHASGGNFGGLEGVAYLLVGAGALIVLPSFRF